jgi:hypothetical protein
MDIYNYIYKHQLDKVGRYNTTIDLTHLRHSPHHQQCGAPSYVYWFINPINHSSLRIINHSFWSYKPT